jgi:RimJ/RimL family protein N-acetyltransferase
MTADSPLNTPIFTGRLIRLCPPRAEDAEQFAAWSADDMYMRLLDDDPVRPQSATNFAHFAEVGNGASGDSYYFHIRALDDDALLGFVVLFDLKWRNGSAALAIGIGDASRRGQGYGSDALRVILTYAFHELMLYRVGLTVLAYNTAAIRAYERVGFVQEGTIRGAVVRGGQRCDLLCYGILREEWAAGGEID